MLLKIVQNLFRVAKGAHAKRTIFFFCCLYFLNYFFNIGFDYITVTDDHGNNFLSVIFQDSISRKDPALTEASKRKLDYAKDYMLKVVLPRLAQERKYDLRDIPRFFILFFFSLYIASIIYGFVYDFPVEDEAVQRDES